MSQTTSFAKRVGLPSLALPVFYWALFVPPGSGPAVEAAGRTPEQLRALTADLQSLMRSGKFDQALEPALQLTSVQPGNHAYLRNLAQIYHGLGRFADEARTWESFEESAPLPAEACPQIGIAYFKLARFEEAGRALEHCFELDKDNADSVFYLALTLERRGNAEKAAEVYRTGLTIAPDYGDLQVGLARTQLHLGKPAEARQAAERVLAHDPSNTDALLVAGLASWRVGDRQAARTYLEKGSHLAPDYTDFRTALNSMAKEPGQ
ncbi:MAG: tetratricopeptide repeat protein [Bryobacteraceae bacterium]